MRPLGKRISPVQFRVRAPVFRWRRAMVAVRQDRSRASAQVSFISPPCPGQHRRLRVLAHGHLASMQQPANRFCKAILPEHHRLEASFHFARAVQALAGGHQETRRRERRQCRCNGGRAQAPAASTSLRSSGFGSASTIFRPVSIKVMQRTFNP
jgi:hypothetical protein